MTLSLLIILTVVSVTVAFLPKLSNPASIKIITEKEIFVPTNEKKYVWDLSDLAFSLLPLAPGIRRRTLIEEVVPNRIWTLDQLQGIINVNVPVRSTIVKLKDGGLFVYNPVAPTQECLEYVRSLEKKHGAVKHIVLGSLGLEHKALCGPFSQFFPSADVWLQPGQWSFPINLPSTFLGFPLGSRLKAIPLDPKMAPWYLDFDHAVLGPLKFNSVGGFGESAFFHRSTNTLIVTDAVVKVGDQPPPIIQEDPRAILYHSRNNALENVTDTTEARLRGWRRMALFGLFFFPSGISVSSIQRAFSDAIRAPAVSKLLGQGSIPFSGALYPWTWVRDDEKSFKALQGGLLVAPILRKLILDREPKKVLAWADTVSAWPIKRIISCHFENNIKASGKDFRRAFNFLEGKKSGGSEPLSEDLSLLSTLDVQLTKFGIVAPSQIQSKEAVKP